MFKTGSFKNERHRGTCLTRKLFILLFIFIIVRKIYFIKRAHVLRSREKSILCETPYYIMLCARYTDCVYTHINKYILFFFLYYLNEFSGTTRLTTCQFPCLTAAIKSVLSSGDISVSEWNGGETKIYMYTRIKYNMRREGGGKCLRAFSKTIK